MSEPLRKVKRRVSFRPLSRTWLSLVALAVAAVGLGLAWQHNAPPKPIIGATVVVTEDSTGLELEARVDTGAGLCSIHCEEIEIPNASAELAENIGRPVRCLLKNNRGETAWLEAQVVDVRGIRTTTKRDDRYVVKLRIRVDDLEDTVLVTLNDRTKMTYPFLLGRNFLRGNFIVDVTRDRELERMADSSASGTDGGSSAAGE